MSGWIGVDLDGTLAVYDGWVHETHIGEPVPAMAFRVRKWLADDRTVKIFTARVSTNQGRAVATVDAIRAAIQDWTEKHFGARLEVVCEKDYGMIELWDDRAVQVVPNTGKRVDGRDAL
jgi:hypothetical protein